MSDRDGHALSPLDGRYRASVQKPAAHFSEFALMRARVRVELAHVRELDATDLFGKLSPENIANIEALELRFGDADYAAIKGIEAQLRHDVKACEVFLRERLGLKNPNRIHFGLTSEDVNNLAYSLCLKDYVEAEQLPLWRALLQTLIGLAKEWRSAAFPARTHGQHASPTTAGKELAVYVTRLTRGYAALATLKLRGKLNGATGNHSAFVAAAPGMDWLQYEAELVSGLGFELNPTTTQIEDHGSLIGYFDLVRSHNNVLIDLCQDLWMYISYGYMVQRKSDGEVGSSTMPHKVNPIRFENAEGNLQLSSALLAFLSDKLSHSRMQRDLSESTVMRNIGVAIGHQHLALLELSKGLTLIDLDGARCLAELREHPEVLSEAIQTALRLVKPDDVYTELKALSRGRTFSRKDLLELAKSLPPALQASLSALAPETYLGNAAVLVDRALQAAERELAQ
jgi:adenylosuccinate lyase